MKLKTLPAAIFQSFFVCLVCFSSGFGQGVATPLTIQGLDHYVPIGAQAQAMGGSAVAFSGTSASLFANPAGLSTLNALEVRVGGSITSTRYKQTQEWLPNRLYAELSLIFDNKETFATKPFDSISPDWTQTNSRIGPGLVSAALPFQIGGTSV